MQVGLLSSSEVLNPILGDILHDEVVRLGFPAGLEEHVLVAPNGVMEHSFLLYERKKVIVSGAQNRLGCGHGRGGCTYEFNFATLHDLGVRLELLRQLQENVTVINRFHRRPVRLHFELRLYLIGARLLTAIFNILRKVYELAYY